MNTMKKAPIRVYSQVLPVEEICNKTFLYPYSGLWLIEDTLCINFHFCFLLLYSLTLLNLIVTISKQFPAVLPYQLQFRALPYMLNTSST